MIPGHAKKVLKVINGMYNNYKKAYLDQRVYLSIENIWLEFNKIKKASSQGL